MVKIMMDRDLWNKFHSTDGEENGWCLDSGTSDASYREL